MSDAYLVYLENMTKSAAKLRDDAEARNLLDLACIYQGWIINIAGLKIELMMKDFLRENR